MERSLSSWGVPRLDLRGLALCSATLILWLQRWVGTNFLTPELEIPKAPQCLTNLSAGKFFLRSILNFFGYYRSQFPLIQDSANSYHKGQ